MKTYSAILILICAGCITSQQQKHYTTAPSHPIPTLSKADELRKMQVCAAILQRQYLDSFFYNPKTDTTLGALFSRLDPFTFYQTEEGSKRLVSEIENEDREIFGISRAYINDTVVVWRVVPGSAAQEIGILPGDRILSVGKYKLMGMGGDSVRRLFKYGLPAKAVVLRPKEWKKHTVKFYKTTIPQAPMGKYFMLDDTTGYLALRHFNRGAYWGVYKALGELTEGGMKQLVFDMRNNGGGLLLEAIQIVDLFVKDSVRLIQTSSIHRESVESFYSTGKGQYSDLRMAIILNSGSASATEIVAGVLQDLDRAVIVGSPSYGKGLIQRELPLWGVSGAIHITTSKMFMPSGRSVQRLYKGDSLIEVLVPDDRFVDNFDHHHERNFRTVDTFVTYSTKRGRKVYAGMGVIPDVIAPWFSNKETEEYAYNDTMNYEMFRLVSENYQNIFEQYSTLDSFIMGFPKCYVWDVMRTQLGKKAALRFSESACKQINLEDIMQWLTITTAEMYFGYDEKSPAMMQTDRRVIAARNFLDTKWKLISPPPSIKKIKKFTQG